MIFMSRFISQILSSSSLRERGALVHLFERCIEHAKQTPRFTEACGQQVFESVVEIIDPLLSDITLTINARGMGKWELERDPFSRETSYVCMQYRSLRQKGDQRFLIMALLLSFEQHATDYLNRLSGSPKTTCYFDAALKSVEALTLKRSTDDIVQGGLKSGADIDIDLFLLISEKGVDLGDLDTALAVLERYLALARLPCLLMPQFETARVARFLIERTSDLTAPALHLHNFSTRIETDILLTYEGLVQKLVLDTLYRTNHTWKDNTRYTTSVMPTQQVRRWKFSFPNSILRKKTRTNGISTTI